MPILFPSQQTVKTIEHFKSISYTFKFKPQTLILLFCVVIVHLDLPTYKLSFSWFISVFQTFHLESFSFCLKHIIYNFFYWGSFCWWQILLCLHKIVFCPHYWKHFHWAWNDSSASNFCQHVEDIIPLPSGFLEY
jgi:hypothetical protein